MEWAIFAMTTWELYIISDEVYDIIVGARAYTAYMTKK